MEENRLIHSDSTNTKGLAGSLISQGLFCFCKGIFPAPGIAESSRHTSCAVVFLSFKGGTVWDRELPRTAHGVCLLLFLTQGRRFFPIASFVRRWFRFALTNDWKMIRVPIYSPTSIHRNPPFPLEGCFISSPLKIRSGKFQASLPVPGLPCIAPW